VAQNIMKQPKEKSPVKSARKIAKKELKERLLTTMKAMFEKEKIKLTKKVKKKSEKLIKTIARKLAEVKPSSEKAVKEIKAVVTLKPATKVVKAKALEPAKKVIATEKAPAKTVKSVVVKAEKK